MDEQGISYADAAERLQNVALACVSQEAVTEGDSKTYARLRRLFLNTDGLRDDLPKAVQDSASLMGLAVSLEGQWQSPDDRRNHLIKRFSSLHSLARGLDEHLGQSSIRVTAEGDFVADAGNASASWTGVVGNVEKVATARALLPVARCALEQLITGLEESSHNGGPMLDERAEALADLRELHGVLGEIIDALEGPRIVQGLGNSLPAEAVRYALRVYGNLKNDPMPAATATLLVTVLSACGFPGAGAFLSGLALIGRKQ